MKNKSKCNRKKSDKEIITIAKLNSLLLALVVVMAFGIGQIGSIDISDAAIGNLNTTSSNWFGTDADEGATMVVGKEGTYIIRITGGGTKSGSTGGDISCVVYLNKNDVLRFDVCLGGVYSTSTEYYSGGKAGIMYVNDIPLIGAGGAGWYLWTDYQKPDTKTLNNQLFSGGGGGDSSGGIAGQTIEGCTPARGIVNSRYGSDNALAGQNYLDDTRADFLEMPNGSTSVSFNVSYSKATSEDIGENTAQMSRSLSSIANSLALSSSVEENIKSDLITVVAGKTFTEITAVSNDNTAGGTANGITVINNVKGDGYVNLTGKINTPGNYQLMIGGVAYTIKVIEEPNSSNITAMF